MILLSLALVSSMLPTISLASLASLVAMDGADNFGDLASLLGYTYIYKPAGRVYPDLETAEYQSDDIRAYILHAIFLDRVVCRLMSRVYQTPSQRGQVN